MSSEGESSEGDGGFEVTLLRGVLSIPLELLRIAAKAWQEGRRRSGLREPQRDAVDEALEDLFWELYDDLSDGDRLLLPGFARVRRNEWRAASAPLSQNYKAERSIKLLKDTVESLISAQTRSAASRGETSALVERGAFLPRLMTARTIPTHLLFIGTLYWGRQRALADVNPAFREAMDEALFDLLLDISKELSADDRLAVPELEAEVEAAGASAGSVPGERVIEILLHVLQQLAQSDSPLSPRSRVIRKTYKDPSQRDASNASSSERMSANNKKRPQSAGGSAAQRSRKRPKPADISEEEHERQERAEAISLAQAVLHATPLEPVFDVPRRQQARPSGQLSVASGDSIMSTASGLSNLRLSDAETATPATSSSSGRQQKLYAHSKRRETLLALRALSDALERQEADMVHSRSSTVVLDGDEYMPDYSNLKIPSLESVRELLGLSDSRHSSQASTQAYIDFSESDMDPRLRAAMLSLETAAATGRAHRIACATRRLQTALHRRVLETNKIKAFEKQREPAPLAIEAPKPRAILLR